MDLKYPYKKQEFRADSDKAELYLSQGKMAIIDLKDLTKCLAYKWSAVTDGFNWYATTNLPRVAGKKHETMKLHRFIMNPSKDMSIDHLNHNGLDNRRVNLRICTHAENTANKKKFKTNTSGITGICKRSRISKRKGDLRSAWVVTICRNYKTKSKSFHSLKKAIKYRKELVGVPST